MPRPKIRLKDILAYVDVDALRTLAAEQLAAGHSREEVIEDIVALVDALVPWAVIIPGPAGVLVEAADGPIATAIAKLVVGVAQATRKKAA
jgi:hypothetical protein